MKTKTKRIAAAMLAAMTIAAVSVPLAGCGGNDTASTSSTQTTATSSTQSTETSSAEAVSSETTSSHVHTWEAATCTEPKTCTTCGATEGKALGHTWVAATCTEPKTCSVCGETKGEATGHKWGDWKVTKKATETSTGTKTKTCKVCGKKKTKTIPVVTLTKKEYKAKCEWLDYDDCSRSPKKFKGDYAKFYGKVLQVIEGSNGYAEYRIGTGGSYYYDDIIYVTYTRGDDDDRILEDDMVTVYGTMGDLYTYESTGSGYITIPLLYAKYADID